jgi:hypothetical protein
MRSEWLSLAVGLSLASAACDWSNVDVDQRTFRCSVDAQCGGGWVCQGNVCVREGTPGDAGLTDAGLTDAGLTDAGLTDAGLTDAGSTDAGLTDAGSTDAGSTDAGSTDAGSTDAGSTNAGSVDAGPMDAGVMRYTISANVTGLAGMGLRLNNNGFDGLEPTGNGVWVFTTMLAPGAPYSVTVSSQPTNAWQTCLVMNAAGTVVSANVTVQVSCTRNTYTIGGNISGLSGPVNLQLTGSGQSQNYSILNAGSFTFTGLRVASGQLYTVTVFINPPNQTCTVMNGTGTVTNADVTNVTVVCTTNTYTVGGTVSGLMGSVLALSLNDAGSPPFSPMMNGSFTFPTPLANGQPYNVTVTTQPSAPNPSCRVINGAGTVMNMNVTNVTVDCIGCMQAGAPCVQGMLPCCMGSCVPTVPGPRCQ